MTGEHLTEADLTEIIESAAKALRSSKFVSLEVARLLRITVPRLVTEVREIRSLLGDSRAETRRLREQMDQPEQPAAAGGVHA